jgi:hypothetical protein
MRKARPELVLLFAALFLSTACGAKGDDDGDDDGEAGSSGESNGSGGSGGSSGSTGSGGISGSATARVTLYDFSSAAATPLCPPPGTSEGCWAVQDYTPGDANYVNVFAGADNADIREDNLTWDGEEGSDGTPGRLKFVIPFTNWNQLADIQINFGGDAKPSDWSGKVLRSQVMIESGGSSAPSYPTGSYMFVKTGTEYVWAKGSSANLGSAMAGLWQPLTFAMESPEDADETKQDYNSAEIVAVGAQVFSGGGSGDEGKPTEAVVYFDTFTLE